MSGQSRFHREGRNPLKRESPNTSSSSDMPISPTREGERGRRWEGEGNGEERQDDGRVRASEERDG